ncbi:MAG: hypothetical protein RIR01_1905 [Bacteroidota bacterium]|jgi:hypothetical protein
MKSELLRKALMAKMAVGGDVEGGDDKAKKQEPAKLKERRLGATTGVDLTEDIILNRDPSQIAKGINYSAWNNFQKFLKKQQIEGKPFVGNPVLNTEEGRKYGQEAIDRWNAGDYVKQFPQNKITPEQILAIQQYHKMVDPKVQAEGWLGTQTSGMRYVQPEISYRGEVLPSGMPGAPLSTEGYIPVVWGNKKYVAPASKISKEGSLDTKEYIPYDPSKHFELLQKPSGRDSYNTFYQQFVPQEKKAKEASLISKKKGGIVARYADGTGLTGVGDYNMFDIKSDSPSMSDMEVSDTGISDLSFDKNSVSVNKDSGSSSKSSSLNQLKNPNVISTIGNLAAGGLDTLDRKDGRSSIAGQTTAGAVRGAAQGFATAGVPGAIIFGTIEAAKGAAKGIKERKERKNITSQETRAKAIEAQESMNPNRGPVKIESYNAKDYDKGIKALFANGGSVKQMPNSVNKINYATGGTIKGPGTGTSDSIVTDINNKGIPEGSFITPAKNNELAKGIRGYILRQNPNKTAEFKKGGTTNSDKVAVSNGEHLFTPKEKKKIVNYLGEEILEKLAPEAEENEMEKNKGGMLKRADGSYSKRGLWDNIRENAGSGKKPTPEMLKQEEKIKAELKKGGYVVKKSSERKGKTHVVIGPDGTKKYFGDSNLGQHPNNPVRKKAFYARHEKNLKKNPYFRAFARETWAEGGTVGSTMEKAKGGELSKEKAKTMLHDKKAHGKPLTDKQRKYFGWVAGGKKSMGGIIGKYANGGTMNRDWEWG